MINVLRMVAEGFVNPMNSPGGVSDTGSLFKQEDSFLLRNALKWIIGQDWTGQLLSLASSALT